MPLPFIASVLVSTSALGAEPAPREAHGFVVHPQLTFVCSQHVTGAPGHGHIVWQLWTSDEPLAPIAAWYRERLPAERLEQDGDAHTWRYPDATKPERVLTLNGADASSKKQVPRCDKEPPATAKTFAVFSSMAR